MPKDVGRRKVKEFRDFLMSGLISPRMSSKLVYVSSETKDHTAAMNPTNHVCYQAVILAVVVWQIGTSLGLK